MESGQKHLEHLIELYFDGLTSRAQEEELRRLAADPAIKGEAIDELRAVMSFSAMSPVKPELSATPNRKPIILRLTAWSAAAAVAIVVAVGGWNAINGSRAGITDGCMAYVDGKPVDDPGEVMRMVDADLSALGEAANGLSEDIDCELGALSSAMNQENSAI